MNRFSVRTCVWLAASFALSTAVFSSTASATILTDGSFEAPVVTAGSFESFSTGNPMGSWNVTGAGSVALVSSTYTSGGFTYPAKEGMQWVDLTGDASNSATGLSQTVPVTLYGVYNLSFNVGNVVDISGAQGTTSSVRVLINGVEQGTFTNDLGTDSTEATWKTFSIPFVAYTATVTVEIINADTAADHANLLDDVSLVRVDAPGGGGGLYGSGGVLGLPSLLLLGLIALRRRASAGRVLRR